MSATTTFRIRLGLGFITFTASVANERGILTLHFLTCHFSCLGAHCHSYPTSLLWIIPSAKARPTTGLTLSWPISWIYPRYRALRKMIRLDHFNTKYLGSQPTANHSKSLVPQNQNDYKLRKMIYDPINKCRRSSDSASNVKNGWSVLFSKCNFISLTLAQRRSFIRPMTICLPRGLFTATGVTVGRVFWRKGLVYDH